MQWPCNDEHPDGTERLYAEGRFFSDPGYCESYGRDLVTEPLEPTEYRAMNPTGKAVIKAAAYLPPHEPTSEDHPLLLITGRTGVRADTTGSSPLADVVPPTIGGTTAEADELRPPAPEGGKA
jgi:hypothetical protein